MKKVLLFIMAFTFLSLSAQDCEDLFFSEYVEGSGNTKCLEIYNPTNEIIDLSQYWVSRFSNGSTIYDNGGKTKLEGFILPYSTFILVNGQTEDIDLGGGTISPKCDPELQALATEVNGMLDNDYPAPTYMNGNDAIALWKDPVGNGDIDYLIPVDLFGTIAKGMKESDEGWASFTQEWAYMNIYEDDVLVGRDSVWISKYIVPEGYYWLPWTANKSLFRKQEIKHGVTINPDSFNVKLEWDTVPGGQDAWDYLNDHECHCESGSAVPKTMQPSDFQISPNPVTQSQFMLYSTMEIASVEVLSITGQILWREKVHGVSGRLTISVDGCPPCIYFVRVKTPGYQTMTKKFTIQ
jgi:hypothetical protein